MMHEIALMYSISDNPHVLRILAHTFVGGLPVPILEYCEKADLKTFLIENIGHHRSELQSVDSHRSLRDSFTDI